MYLIAHACSGFVRLNYKMEDIMYVFFSCLAIHPNKLFIGHRKTCLKLQNNLKQMDVVLFCF